MHARQQVLEAVAELIDGEVQSVYPLLTQAESVRVEWESDNVTEVYMGGSGSQLCKRELQVNVEVQRRTTRDNYQFIDAECAAIETNLASTTLNGLVDSWRLNNSTLSRDIDGEYLCITATLTYLAEYVTDSSDPETIR